MRVWVSPSSAPSVSISAAGVRGEGISTSRIGSLWAKARSCAAIAAATTRPPSSVHASGGARRPTKRSEVLAAHDAALRADIERLEARLANSETSAAAKHGIKRMIQQKKAALKRDAVPALAR